MGKKISGTKVARQALKHFSTITPAKHRGKQATLTGWPDILITESNYQDYFGEERCNVANLNGQGNNPLVDVDCDDEYFAELWRSAGLETELTTGREDEGATHFFYQIADHLPKSIKFLDEDKSCIAEIRSKGSCTLIPPSIHEDGDKVVYYAKEKADTAKNDDLIRRMNLCVSLRLLLDYYPQKGGSRHDFCLIVAGLLANAGYAYEDSKRPFKVFVRLAGDEEIHDRIRCLRDTFKHHESGNHVPGISKLSEYVSAKTSQLIGNYLEQDTESRIEKIIEDLNCKYALVNVSGKVVILEETNDYHTNFPKYELLAERDFKRLLSNTRETVRFNSRGQPIQKTHAEIWLNSPNRRQYEDLIFDPGPNIPEHVYNTYFGFTVEPDKSKSCKRFLTHTRQIICDGDDDIHDWVINHLASIVQSPHVKSCVALALRGVQGAGKSLFFEYIGRIFGPYYLTVSQPDQVVGKFNAHLQNKIILVVEEGFWAGDKKSKSVIKDLITNPTLKVERKGFDVQGTHNFINVFFTSNESFVVPISERERRFAIFDVSDRKVGNKAYFKSLVQEMENGGVEALLHYLLTYEVDEDFVKDIPKTKAAHEQFIHGLNSEGKFIYESLVRGSFSKQYSLLQARYGAIPVQAGS